MHKVDDGGIVGRDWRVARAVRSTGVDLDRDLAGAQATREHVKLLMASIQDGANLSGDFDLTVQHDHALLFPYATWPFAHFTIRPDAAHIHRPFGGRGVTLAYPA